MLLISTYSLKPNSQLQSKLKPEFSNSSACLLVIFRSIVVSESPRNLVESHLKLRFWKILLKYETDGLVLPLTAEHSATEWLWPLLLLGIIKYNSETIHLFIAFYLYFRARQLCCIYQVCLLLWKTCIGDTTTTTQLCSFYSKTQYLLSNHCILVVVIGYKYYLE